MLQRACAYLCYTRLPVLSRMLSQHLQVSMVCQRKLKLPLVPPHACVQQMLEYDPLKRITAEDALRHEYFQEDPKPGPNAFVYGTTPVVVYPRRGRHNVPGAHVPPQDPHAPQVRPVGACIEFMEPSCAGWAYLWN